MRNVTLCGNVFEINMENDNKTKTYDILYIHREHSVSETLAKNLYDLKLEAIFIICLDFAGKR